MYSPAPTPYSPECVEVDLSGVPVLRSEPGRLLPPGEYGSDIALVLLWTGLIASGLLYIIVGWAFATGVLKILTAILLRAEVENAWLLAGSGALSVLFGILLAALAGSDVPFLAPFIGVFAVVVGLTLIVFAFRLRDRRP